MPPKPLEIEGLWNAAFIAQELGLPYWTVQRRINRWKLEPALTVGSTHFYDQRAIEELRGEE